MNIVRTEEYLVNQISLGDPNAFGELVKKYDKAVFLYALKILNNNVQDAEDVAIDSWTKVYFNISTYDHKRSFVTWVYRITHNVAVDLIRKKAKTYTSNIENYEKKLSIVNTIEDNYEFVVQQILARLRPDDRTLLVLFFVEGRSIKEISQMMSILPKLTSLKLFRAKTRARDIANMIKD
jgi:RNA polymerase sigma-70 factor, ECF subfamily